jgi:hypothetical protein
MRNGCLIKRGFEYMGWQDAFNGIAGFLIVIFGWMLRNITDSVKGLREKDDHLNDKINDHEVKVAAQYVHKDDMGSLRDAIFKKLDRIEDKLDGKADRRTQ